MSTLDALLGRREAPDQVTTGSHSRVCARLGVVLGVPACLLLLLLIGLGINAPPADAFSAANPGSQERLAGPRVASPVWIVTGENDGDRLGYSAAMAGDLNGDGYADVILGAFGYLGKMAKQWDVTLAPASAAHSGDPGTTITYTLVLTNEGNGWDTFTVMVGSTAFATTVTPSSVGPLAKRQSQTVTVMVQIPANAAGDLTDTATLTATSQGDASQSASSTLTTTVNRVRHVALASPAAARSGDPGATVTYTLVLTNAGNTSDTFRLTVSNTAFATTVTPSSVGPLSAGASRSVTVTVQIPANAAGGLTDTATLTATSRGDASQSASSTLVTMASTARGVYLPLLQKNSFCDQYEPNDNRPINGGTPWGPLTSGQIVHSQICPGDPRDLYYFNAGGAVQVTIDLTNVPGNADFGLYLWNESGAVSLAGSRKGTGQNEHIVFTLPGAGRYYIDVYPWSGSGPYTLQGSGW